MSGRWSAASITFQSACSQPNRAPVKRVTTLKRHSTARDNLRTASIRCAGGWMRTRPGVTAMRKVNNAASSKANKVNSRDSKANQDSRGNQVNRVKDSKDNKVNRDSKVNKDNKARSEASKASKASGEIHKTDRIRRMVVRVAPMTVGADPAGEMIVN